MSKKSMKFSIPRIFKGELAETLLDYFTGCLLWVALWSFGMALVFIGAVFIAYLVS